jgi:starch synthase (maltosyl-transferring)
MAEAARTQPAVRRRASATPSGTRATTVNATLEAMDGRVRAVIDAVAPVVDAGRFAAKCLAGEPVRVEAHCFTDGHDRLRVVLRWRRSMPADAGEEEVEMTALGNDVWCAEFTPPVPGRYRFKVIAWVDAFESWRAELERRVELADVRVALEVGSALIEQAAARQTAARRTAARGPDPDGTSLRAWAQELEHAARRTDTAVDAASLKALALDPARARILRRHADRRFAVEASYELVADRQRAAFSSWYELFPRSAAPEAARHGTFRDVEARLPYVAGMGFDVLYLPPIQPIGKVHRKGANNALEATPEDVGSPWAIGSAEGGHCAVLPALGTIEDFRHLLDCARGLKMEVALDLAFQCAPDHPYVREHPSWFKHRPDGSIQYAENPPKKYQDIYPFDFETGDWRALWAELKRIVEFWMAQGVRIFRVDNPHTKPFAFWEWLIGEIKGENPDVIFLAEAFTRPKVMHRLAKVGFSQSYTYFTWRNSKRELTEYFTELARGPGRRYFRPNVWPNTPDILHEALQSGLRATFAARLVLAATLSASYGIYGPTYELMESTPREPGSEEYRDSEKYQLRHWTLDRPDSLASLIVRVNRIRRENRALQSNESLEFVRIDNDQLIAYLKSDPARTDLVLVVVNLDPHHVQSGWLELDLAALALDAERPYQAHDLLSEQRFEWRGARNFVTLDPDRLPAHVLRLRRHVRSEHDFDYYS